MIQGLLPYTQLMLSICNLAVLAYAFKKFLGKPHENLEKRVSAVEFEVKEIKDSLKQGNDRFRSQENINKVLIYSILALIDFEIHYCETEHKPVSKALEKAKNDLDEFFAENRKL